MLGCCRSRLSHFPKTYAEGAGSSETNPAPPRPDPLEAVMNLLGNGLGMDKTGDHR
jgi:hypothetical protein